MAIYSLMIHVNADHPWEISLRDLQFSRFCWCSLSLSITVSVIALVAKLWLVNYSHQVFSVGSPYDRAMKRWWVCQSLCASQQKQMQVRWGLRSPRTEYKHHDQRRTGSRTVCTKRTARYEPTRTALRGYDERNTSRGHDFYVPRMQSNGSYQKRGT